MDDLFDTWWKLFDDYGVDMIFNVEVNGNELILKAIDAETGEKFDELILENKIHADLADRSWDAVRSVLAAQGDLSPFPCNP